MRSRKLTYQDGRVLELRDRGDGTYYQVMDGKITGWGTWLTEAEKAVLQDLEDKMILGSAMVGLDEEGNWKSAEKINKHWKLKSNKMEDFKKRLIDEERKLAKKHEKLRVFIISEKFDEINSEHRVLLSLQHDAMSMYLKCLQSRLDLL